MSDLLYVDDDVRALLAAELGGQSFSHIAEDMRDFADACRFRVAVPECDAKVIHCDVLLSSERNCSLGQSRHGNGHIVKGRSVASLDKWTSMVGCHR